MGRKHDRVKECETLMKHVATGSGMFERPRRLCLDTLTVRLLKSPQAMRQPQVALLAANSAFRVVASGIQEGIPAALDGEVYCDALARYVLKVWTLRLCCHCRRKKPESGYNWLRCIQLPSRHSDVPAGVLLRLCGRMKDIERHARRWWLLCSNMGWNDLA